jgi:hypothetical protein
LNDYTLSKTSRPVNMTPEAMIARAKKATEGLLAIAEMDISEFIYYCDCGHPDYDHLAAKSPVLGMILVRAATLTRPASANASQREKSHPPNARIAPGAGMENGASVMR